MSGRPWSWITGRPHLTDGIIVVFNLAAGAGAIVSNAFRPSLLPIVLPVVVINAAALWWRRTYPATVLAVIVVTGLVWFVSVPEREWATPALAFAVYAVSVYGGARVRLWVAATAMAIVLAAVAALLLGHFQAVRGILPAGATALIAWVTGDYFRSRRRLILDLIERHRQEREQAAEAERLRIARELHDVVAHNVSLMAIQAGAARVSGNASKESLESIEREARDTLAELNKLLGVLRKGPGAPELTPQPTLDDVDELLQPARDAGLKATIRVAGEPRRLTAAAELSAYRIVQEAITNVLKHASATRVEVTVEYRSDSMVLTVSDNGAGPVATESPGHGLIGMRERVELFGGDLTMGSSSLGGFRVRATLPVES